MVEQRKVQKVSHSTLSVTIPREMARELGITVGDSLIFRVEADGTLRLIPVGSAKESSRVMLRADGLSEDMLSRLIVGSYALGYDVIEVIRQEPFDRAVLDRTTAEMNRLKGLEVVESTDRKIVAQNFSDPTKFPVDSLIKRLQMQVSRSLDNIIEAVDLKKTGSLNEVARVKNEINELYWLIVRQLLVALNRRELASEIGLESPLHASGDRLVAKTLDEIGRIIIEIADELVRLKSRGVKMDAKMAGDIRRLAWMAREAFNVTVEGLLAPDVKLVERASSLVRQTSDLEKELTHGMLETGEHGYARMLVSYFGQLARYCNIIIEISSHRLLRKTSRVASVQRR